MTVILSWNSDLTVRSQVFAVFMCMGIPAPTSGPSRMLTDGSLSTPWPQAGCSETALQTPKDEEGTGTSAVFQGLTDHCTHAALTKPLAIAQRSNSAAEKLCTASNPHAPSINNHELDN